MRAVLVLAVTTLCGGCSAIPTEASAAKKPLQNEELQSSTPTSSLTVSGGNAEASAKISPLTKVSSKSSAQASASDSSRDENQGSSSFGEHGHGLISLGSQGSIGFGVQGSGSIGGQGLGSIGGQGLGSIGSQGSGSIGGHGLGSIGGHGLGSIGGQGLGSIGGQGSGSIGGQGLGSIGGHGLGSIGGQGLGSIGGQGLGSIGSQGSGSIGVQGLGGFGVHGSGGIGVQGLGGIGLQGSGGIGGQGSEEDYLGKNIPYGGLDSNGEYEDQEDGISNQEESGGFNNNDVNSQNNDNSRGDIGGLSAALLLAHHANLAHLNHLLHLSHHLWVPEIIGLNFLTRGVPGASLGGLVNLWPLHHHLNTHKLKELVYVNALSKSLPNLAKSTLSAHGKILGLPSAGLQVSNKGWSGQGAVGLRGKHVIY